MNEVRTQNELPDRIASQCYIRTLATNTVAFNFCFYIPMLLPLGASQAVIVDRKYFRVPQDFLTAFSRDVVSELYLQLILGHIAKAYHQDIWEFDKYGYNLCFTTE